MGYCMEMTEGEFFIEASKLPEALAAIKELDPTKGGGGSRTDKWFSWVVTSEYKEANTIVEAIGAWRWEVLLDAEGNVYQIEFDGEKLGDDHHLWGAIAPFVKEGSFIEMKGEDGESWRWVFRAGKCEELRPEVTWDMN